MSADPPGEHEPPPRRPRTQAELPPSVLDVVAGRTGEAPRVSLRDEGTGGGPVIAPGSDERASVPLGRGAYQILGEIARGGMGVVLRGHDGDLGRDVAMKVLSKELADRPDVVQRFVEEAQIGGQLQHPGIVPVYELGLMADERPYFTMKLVKGKTLSAMLAGRRAPDEDRRRFLAVFESICQTMAYAHSKGVIHRDLKPANVMVGAFGEVQVVDWGLAKVLGGGGVADELRARRAERTVIETVRSGPGSGGSDSVLGSVMGTPAYMPPEQAMGKLEAVDERSDVFSLGAILCELLTGQPPYVAAEKERTVVLAAHARLEPALERLAACAADRELKELCEECLSTAPAARPRDAAEVAERIHAHLAGVEERAHEAELRVERERVQAGEARRRLRLTLALAATVLVSVVAIGGVVRRMERQRDAQRFERLEAASRALDEAQAKVAALQDEGRDAEALEVARAARVTALPAAGADPAHEQRALELIAQAEERVAAREAARALGARNAALLARCDDLRMRQIEANFGFSPPDLTERVDEDYEQAFRDYGIDPDDEDLPATMETLRESGIAVEAALALDDWASVRRRRFGAESYEVESVTALAIDLDPDPLRTRMRAALLANDRAELLALAEQEELRQLSPSTFWVLSQGLVWMGLDDESLRVVRAGVEAHPDDFLLNLRLGDAYLDRDQDEAALPYLAAARALRPDNGPVHALLGDAYNHLGHAPTAMRCYLEVLRLRPEYSAIHRFVGWFAMLAGEGEIAADAYDRVREVAPHRDDWAFEGELARAFAGRQPLAAVVARYPAPDEDQRFWLGWLLVALPDRAQRDPARAIELLRHRAAEPDATMARVLMALAHLQLDEPDEARAWLDGLDMSGFDRSRNPPAIAALVRAWTAHALGRGADAEAALELAEDLLDEVYFDGPEPWAGSTMRHLQLHVTALVRG